MYNFGTSFEYQIMLYTTHKLKVGFVSKQARFMTQTLPVLFKASIHLCDDFEHSVFDLIML